MHRDVRNPGIEKFLPLLHIAMPRIEGFGLPLRVEPHDVIAARFRRLHQRQQQAAADTGGTMLAPHCHAADMAIRQQARGADRVRSLISHDMES